MTKEIFALDLGNKQTKLKSSKGEHVLPSHFLKKRRLGTSIGNSFDNLDLTTFSVPFSNEEYVWSNTIDSLHLDSKMTDTLVRGNRYAKPAFKLLANFALGLMASDFEGASSKILEVELVVGLPSKDYIEEEKTDALVEVLKDQHQVKLDVETYTIKVSDITILPQPFGTLYQQLIDDQGLILDDSLKASKVGIIDVGGGTILIDTINNLMADNSVSKQINSGVDSLYRNIAENLKGEVSVYKIDKALRSQDRVYEYSQNNKIDISELASQSIDDFTEDLINSINSTLDDIVSMDALIFTGGGTNLINAKMIQEEYDNVTFVEDPELANVRGFYKLGLQGD